MKPTTRDPYAIIKLVHTFIYTT